MYDIFRGYIDLVQGDPESNTKRVDITGNSATSETILANQYRLKFLKPHSHGKTCVVMQIYDSE